MCNVSQTLLAMQQIIIQQKKTRLQQMFPERDTLKQIVIGDPTNPALSTYTWSNERINSLEIQLIQHFSTYTWSNERINSEIICFVI